MAEREGANWGAVGAAIDGGHVYLERTVAQRCAQRCAEFVGQLRKIQFDAIALERIDGFGNLPSGVALAAKFGKKAVGGDYSMDQAIADHIAVVQEMQQTFEKIEAMYVASEERNRAGIDRAGSPL
ncbi:hypothetical protein [Rhodococcus maanshanensis]|uniref:Uncharacterized protein n=1 Tax=Rhodococcus maanshanensis TaxID=183556 RepID=A0A1H7PL28_9NOCA|nr:hypothetical protein [Rhodococcus maanshanensis]SEL35955.1 hypothetical protein SAMN05444583_10875 [Rhodococcus maanshanensis]